MKLFDYIFYRAHNLFLKIPRKSYTADIQALCAVSTLQFFNLLFFELLFSYLKKEALFSLNKYLIGGTIAFLILLNYLRYWGNSNIKELGKKWKNESNDQKLIRGIFVIIYVLLSIVLAVGSAHYVGKYFREH